MGITGVVFLAGMESLHLPEGAHWVMLAAAGAALSYSLASLYARQGPAVEAFNNAHGNMWGAAIMMLPMALMSSMPHPELALSWPVAISVVGLGVVCSGIAYLLYFKLINTIGATSALTVTFLIPVFGIAFGYVFLGEPIGWYTLVGAATVLCGTALVTGFSPRRLRKSHV